MKTELHLHTTRYSGCAMNSPVESMRKLVDCGYEAVYITEHDAVWSRDELLDLRISFPEMRIFPGVELTLDLASFQHLLVLGTNDPAYLALHEPAAVIEKARSEGHLTILAHPFRWEGASDLLDGGPMPDAIEYHTCNHSPDMAAASYAASMGLSLPLVNAGDVHAMDFIDRYWIDTLRPIEKADDIRDIILAGDYTNEEFND